MKYILIGILVLATCISCKQAGSKTGSVIDGSDTQSISKKHSVTPTISTTLDSLQGAWKHTGEDPGKIKINGDTIFRYLDDDKPDTSFFVLSDSCTQEKTVTDNKKENGNKILEYSSKTNNTDDYIMCFNIDYLANDSLILFYEGGAAPKPMLYIRTHSPK